jgi:hypothetical protein
LAAAVLLVLVQLKEHLVAIRCFLQSLALVVAAEVAETQLMMLLQTV